MRSLLLIHPESADPLERMWTSGTDAILVDLAATEAAQVAQSRRAAVAAITALRETAGLQRVFVSIHATATGWADGDLDSVMLAAPHGVFLPGPAAAMDISLLDARLSLREALHGLEDGSTTILAGCGHAGTTFATGHPVSLSRRLVGLVNAGPEIGNSGGADEGSTGFSYRPPSMLARELCVLAAHASGLPALDRGSACCDDVHRLAAECRTARDEGFSGKLAVHPDQVRVINEVFTE